MRTLKNRSRRLFLGLSIGILVSASVGSAAMSTALFTDQKTVNNTFTAGSILLNAAAISALSLTSANLMPGDTVTGAVVVQNDGTSQLRYNLATASTNTDTKGLRQQLTLTIKTIDVTTPATPCDNFDGTTTILATTALHNGTVGIGFGSAATGAQAGDRNLNAATSETLCLRVNLPTATGNTYESASTVTTFTFDAEQTANNP
jgi:predicted ribosomally synthesized peptide with SipW-like signal peptide